MNRYEDKDCKDLESTSKLCGVEVKIRPCIHEMDLIILYIVTPQIFGGHFFFFFFLSDKSSMYFSFTYPKYMKLYCSKIFLQNAAQGHNPTFSLLTASRERRLLVYLKGGSHDGVSKAQ